MNFGRERLKPKVGIGCRYAHLDLPRDKLLILTERSGIGVNIPQKSSL